MLPTLDRRYQQVLSKKHVAYLLHKRFLMSLVIIILINGKSRIGMETKILMHQPIVSN